MGMESYSLTVVAKDVSVAFEDKYQILIGKSMIKTVDLEKVLKDKKIQCIQEGKWLYDDCLELFLYQQSDTVQGLEIKGCLSWLEEGVKECFRIINTIEKMYCELDIYVLGKKIKCDTEEELYNYICNVYSEKISIFSKQYKNIELKATCGKFYKEIDRRDSFIYKLSKWFRGIVAIKFIGGIRNN